MKWSFREFAKNLQKKIDEQIKYNTIEGDRSMAIYNTVMEPLLFSLGVDFIFFLFILPFVLYTKNRKLLFFALIPLLISLFLMMCNLAYIICYKIWSMGITKKSDEK